MAGHDAVIHLAFAVQRKAHTAAERQDINVRGSQNIVDAALKNNIQKFINLSSVSVYGGGDNIREETPTKPSKTFDYAQHKEDVEKYINQNLPTAVQFRSHLIQGANAQRFVREMFFYPFWIKFKGNVKPRQQVVHENDVADAIMLALKSNVSGTFNLAASDIVTYGDDYIKKRMEEGRKMRKLPFWLVRRLARIMPYIDRRTHINDLYTWIEMLDTNLNVNCDKTKTVLGWTPKFSAWDARKDAMASMKKRP
jgi:nucleoside-diphosphate-sugar epimerase